VSTAVVTGTQELDGAPGAADKALLVLACVASSERPARLSDIVGGTGLPKSTVHRLLTILQLHRAVQRRGETYTIGSMVLRAARGASAQRMRHVAVPHLVELYDAVRRPVSLAVLRDNNVEYLNALYPAAYLSVIPRPGDEVSAFCTSAGELLLAYTSSDDDAPKEQLDRSLEIRLRGIAFREGEFAPGLCGMAAPVWVGGVQPVAAISVAGARDQFDAERIDPLLRRAAFAVSQALGHPNGAAR